MSEGLDTEDISKFTKGSHIPKDMRISFNIPNTKEEDAFTIMMRDSDKKNLDELLQDKIQSHKDSESFWGYKEEILEITDIILSNEPTKKIIVYLEEYDRKILQILSLHDNKSYSLLYRMNSDSFKDHIPTIDKIVKSIKFINNE